jgi:conjugative relaxase-like TrwC/TraI family protein
MSIHKLTAGSGYDYLTRQVAALDATEKGHVPLASYYTERGETPGVWIGSGLAGIGGLKTGDPVAAEQMQALFGVGLHPLAGQRQQQLEGPDLTVRDYQLVTRLGAPFKIYANDIPPFRVEVARRIAAAAAGLARDWPIPRSERARIRTEVATEFFAAAHGRPPQDAREFAAAIAKHSRPQTTAVAGYDLTFSPVKSVSTLWALAEPAVAAQIEKAHRAAVSDALGFIERHALFSRTGANGVRQVNVQGLVAAAFTHRDSRAGDPDLHTHVAVANKVQTLDGRWLSIDGRILFKATVAASETYNTALEHHLRDSLSLRFAERPNQDARKQPVREIVGIHPDLITRWSTRRASIEARRSALAGEFQRIHGRPPTPVESLQLAQQATLETREAKHHPRSLAEQRQAWFGQAAEVLGGPNAAQAMVQAALSPSPLTEWHPNASWLNEAADRVLSAMEERRSTWQSWHVRAEAQRNIRAADIPTSQANQLVDLLVDEVLNRRSISLARPDAITEPKPLQRSDGASVYTVAHPPRRWRWCIRRDTLRSQSAAARRPGSDPDDLSMRLCPETIYRELLLRNNTTLHNRYCLKLRTGRRIRKSRWLTRTGHGPTITNKTLIDKRPASAETKLEAGYWEGDMIIGVGSASAMVTLRERTTQIRHHHQLASRSHRQQRQHRRHRSVRRDADAHETNPHLGGVEMARHQELTAATGVPVFFAERSSPWQRGANENYNGLVRQYFPKGTNLAVHPPVHVAYVTGELNDRPRKGLGYDTPAVRFATETAAITTR